MSQTQSTKSVIGKLLYEFNTKTFYQITKENEMLQPTEYQHPETLELNKLDPNTQPFCIADTEREVIQIMAELAHYQSKVIWEQSLRVREQELQITQLK